MLSADGFNGIPLVSITVSWSSGIPMVVVAETTTGGGVATLDAHGDSLERNGGENVVPLIRYLSKQEAWYHHQTWGKQMGTQ